jgi:hypothetical protein
MRTLALPFLFLLANPVWADECDKLPPPSVKLKRLEEPFSLNTTYGYRSLTNLGSEQAKPGHLVLGLTRGNAVVKFETRMPGFIDPSGRWECSSPQLVVTYGFSPMTVYVAREFPEGKCAYTEIYQHELRHVKAYQDHIISLEKELTETMSRWFAGGGPWRGPAGENRERVQQQLEERWMPYIKREIAKVDIAQAKIDTPEEYARVANSCNGEIKQATR